VFSYRPWRIVQQGHVYLWFRSNSMEASYRTWIQRSLHPTCQNRSLVPRSARPSPQRHGRRADGASGCWRRRHARSSSASSRVALASPAARHGIPAPAGAGEALPVRPRNRRLLQPRRRPLLPVRREGALEVELHGEGRGPAHGQVRWRRARVAGPPRRWPTHARRAAAPASSWAFRVAGQLMPAAQQPPPGLSALLWPTRALVRSTGWCGR
jgi:hypothetical protein